MPPVLRVIRGVPVTVTFSLKVTVIGITVPTGYEPLAVVDVMLVTVGAVTSRILMVAELVDIWLFESVTRSETVVDPAVNPAAEDVCVEPVSFPRVAPAPVSP